MPEWPGLRGGRLRIFPSPSCAATSGPTCPSTIRRSACITCPFTGERLAAVPAIRPDVAVIHAQKADRKGNVLLWGIVGVQKEVVLAARRAIVTVEEIVERLEARANAVMLPGWVVSAVCDSPEAALSLVRARLLQRDNAFYQAWDRDRARAATALLAWIERHVLGTADFAEFRRSLAAGGAN